MIEPLVTIFGTHDDLMAPWSGIDNGFRMSKSQDRTAGMF